MDYLEIFRLEYSLSERLSIKLGKKLSKLYLKSNKIKNLTIQLNNNNILDNLDLANNSISNICFDYMKNLDNLILTSNLIENISINSFSNLTKIRGLFLNKNRINSVQAESFSSLKNLALLDLSFNKLNENLIIKNLNSLTTLKITNNNFKSFTQNNFPDSYRLSSLDLSNNQIEFIQLNFTNLISLILANNKIKSFSQLDINNVQFLDLNHNFIQVFEIENIALAKSIQNLILTRNQITAIEKIQMENFQNLNLLYLNENLLKEIEFPFLNKLERVNLANNRILSIKKVTLKICPTWHIFLENNFISEIEANSFEFNSKLIVLYLANNSLSQIPGPYYFAQMVNLDLSNQKSNFTLNSNILDLIQTKKMLELNLINNKLTYISPHAFCELKAKEMHFQIRFSNLGLINKCILKQPSYSNVTFISNSKIDCSVKKMSEKYNNLEFFDYSMRQSCSNATFIDECTSETNLKFDCSKDLTDFKRLTSFIFGLRNKSCENCVCFKSNNFEILCSFSLRNSSIAYLTEVNLLIKDQQIETSFYFNFTSESGNISKKNKDFYFQAYKNNKIFYFTKSNSVIVLTKFSSFYSLILRAYENFYSKISGILVNENSSITACGSFE